MKFKVLKEEIEKVFANKGEYTFNWSIVAGELLLFDDFPDEIKLEGEPVCWKNVPYTVVHGSTDGNLCLNCGMRFKTTPGCLQIEKKKVKDWNKRNFLLRKEKSKKKKSYDILTDFGKANSEEAMKLLRKNGYISLANCLERTLDKPSKKEKKIIEQLADIEHQRWAKWQQYVFDECTPNEDGSMTIPSMLVAGWGRQIATKYLKLTEEEKQSDRNQVMKYWPIIKKLIQI